LPFDQKGKLFSLFALIRVIRGQLFFYLSLLSYLSLFSFSVCFRGQYFILAWITRLKRVMTIGGKPILWGLKKSCSESPPPVNPDVYQGVQSAQDVSVHRSTTYPRSPDAATSYQRQSADKLFFSVFPCPSVCSVGNNLLLRIAKPGPRFFGREALPQNDKKKNAHSGHPTPANSGTNPVSRLDQTRQTPEA